MGGSGGSSRGELKVPSLTSKWTRGSLDVTPLSLPASVAILEHTQVCTVVQKENEPHQFQLSSTRAQGREREVEGAGEEARKGERRRRLTGRPCTPGSARRHLSVQENFV